MLERDYQPRLIERLKAIYPGCFVLKTDSSQRQGMPDLVILFEDKWAVLEVKRSGAASYRPNQSFYCMMLDKMGFARTIFPENERQVLRELTEYFDLGGDQQ